MPAFGNIATTLAENLKEEPTEEESNNYSQAHITYFFLERLEYLISQLDKITLCQAQVRKHQAQKKYRDTRKKVIKCQAQVKMHLARKKYLNKRLLWKNSIPQITKIQALWRGKRDRKQFNDRHNFFKNHLNEIIRIQAKWRARHAEKAYRSLAHMNNPPVAVLQEFLHLLDDSEHDFEEELGNKKISIY